MTAAPAPLRSAFLVTVPLLVLLAGISSILSSPWHPGSEEFPLMALAVAGVSPVVAVFLLQVIVPGFDRVLIGVAAALTSISMSFLTTLALQPDGSDPFYLAIVSRQGWFIGAGFGALVLGAVLARRADMLRRYPMTALGVALALSAVTAVVGAEVNGARLWLNVGPVQFQPSEVVRLAVVAFAAAYLHERRHLVAGVWRLGPIDLPPIPHLTPLVIAVVAAMGMLLVQNDLGMAALIALGALAVVLGTGGSRTLTILALAIASAAAAGSYFAVARVRDRVGGWLDPWQDPAGRGFQLVQSEFALSAGGVGGGVNAAAASNVPEVHTDFILPGIGSVFGHLVAIAAVALAGLLVARCFLAGLRAQNGFRALLALGIASLLAIQIVLIAGGTLRLLPLTGLTFPLLSYGGTSMIVTLFALGIELGLGARGEAELPAGGGSSSYRIRRLGFERRVHIQGEG